MEEIALHIDGVSYRIFESKYSPGSGLRFPHNHPEFIPEDFTCSLILREDEERDCWRTLEPHEEEQFLKKHFNLILTKTREKVRSRYLEILAGWRIA